MCETIISWETRSLKATEKQTEICICGARLPLVDDPHSPKHRYMLSTSSCWHAYGHLLAREYEDPTRWRNHRYTVDAYAVQHPGVDTQQARNSVGIHLSRLCLLLDRGWPLERANDAMLQITAKKFSYPWLTPPTVLAGVNAGDVLRTVDSQAHLAAVLRWAETVWQSWREHHEIVRQWMAALT